MTHLRYRFGAWLLRPYLAERIREYAKAEYKQRAAGNRREADNCDYIIIGLRYAAWPRRTR